MAVDTPVTTPPATLRESTRRITCECPFGGPNTLQLHREVAELDANGNLLRLQTPWKDITKPAADVAAIVFTRPDGTTFTGAAMMTDMQIACDAIALAAKM